MYQRLTMTVDPDPIQVRRASCVLLALTLSFLWDAKFHPSNFGDCLPAYGVEEDIAVTSVDLMDFRACSASILSYTH